ncbi:MAG: methionine adenosyltransferase [Verrucomicrobiota bacterium]|nr:methionine adenosyltransferase [Verrucomicrobiota bacterium]
MSKIKSNHIFTSESVSEGHPDKICDQISDAILDECIKLDPFSRVACETLTTTNLVINAGEITCKDWNKINPEDIARNVVHEIGYNNDELKFSSQSFEYINRIHNQSADISQGVTEGEGQFVEQGAGDQGMMFGYADNSTNEFMPAPIAFSHRLLDELQKIRKNGTIPYLRPDSKSQVSVKYENGIPKEIDSVVISHQTDDNIPLAQIEDDMIKVAKDVLDSTELISSKTKFIINPTGRFVTGGPHGDAGLTGRKIIVDTYGGVGSHGGGAFSGKDPSKVDRSAAYYARYAAKNIVASGIAKKCEIQVAYAIGISEPLSINVDTYGTSSVNDKLIQEMLLSKEIFDFRPSKLIDDLKLLNPFGWSYKDTAAYGHFGRNRFPWEKIDKVDQIIKFLE